jgi:putative inorganic carbon (hco3(-)) transporter
MLFFGFLIFLFLQIIRPQDFVPGLAGTRLVLYLMAILLFVLLFSPIDKRFLKSPQDKFAGIFFLAIAISTFSQFWVSYMVETAIYSLKAASMFYFAVIVCGEEKKIKIATWVTVFFMALVGLMGVLQYHGINITGAVMQYSAVKQAWQIYGIGNFDNPNDLAYSVILVVPFSLGLLFQTKKFLVRLSALILVALSLYCIYLTRSRGGQIALGACLGTWTYFWISNKEWKKRLIVLASTAIIALLVFQATGYREDESAMGRIDAWAAGWVELKSNPITGVGKGRFGEYHSRDTHSSYVKTGVETGLMGLYGFVGLIYFCVVTMFKIDASRDRLKWRIYSSGYGSFLISYIIASIFSTRSYDLVFLICAAFTGVLGRISLQEPDVSNEGVLFPEVRLLNKNAFGLSIGVLLLWYIFLRTVW